jgi:hypothetical protein
MTAFEINNISALPHSACLTLELKCGQLSNTRNFFPLFCPQSDGSRIVHTDAELCAASLSNCDVSEQSRCLKQNEYQATESGRMECVIQVVRCDDASCVTLSPAVGASARGGRGGGVVNAKLTCAGVRRREKMG